MTEDTIYKITMDELIGTGDKPTYHGKLEACDINDCYRVASMEVMFDDGDVILLCDVHYLIYLSYLGMAGESKL